MPSLQAGKVVMSIRVLKVVSGIEGGLLDKPKKASETSCSGLH